MKKNCLAKILVIGLIILFVGTSFTPSTISMTVTKHNSAHNMRILNGHILFTPQGSTTTYLIDNTGEVNHTRPR